MTCDSVARPFESLERRYVGTNPAEGAAKTKSADCVSSAPSWDGERSMAARHKFSDSHSSLSSYGSWQSRSHSRISSVTTISGSHGGGLSLAELPILEFRDAERDEAKRNPPYGDEQSRLPAPARRQLPMLVMEAAQPRRPGSPSDAVLNMKGLAKAQLNPDGPR